MKQLIQLIAYKYGVSNVTIPINTTDYAKAKKVAEVNYDPNTTDRIVIYVENVEVATYQGYWTNAIEEQYERYHHGN